MRTKLVYLSGILIPIVYIFMYLLGGALRPGYSHISNSVSELLSPGAPNKLLLTTIQLIYALLHIVFGFSVLWYVNGVALDPMFGRIGAWLIIALGVVTIGTVLFRQDAEGSTATTAGQVHKVGLAGPWSKLNMLAWLSGLQQSLRNSGI